MKIIKKTKKGNKELFIVSLVFILLFIGMVIADPPTDTLTDSSGDATSGTDNPAPKIEDVLKIENDVKLIETISSHPNLLSNQKVIDKLISIKEDSLLIDLFLTHPEIAVQHDALISKVDELAGKGSLNILANADLFKKWAEKQWNVYFENMNGLAPILSYNKDKGILELKQGDATTYVNLKTLKDQKYAGILQVQLDGRIKITASQFSKESILLRGGVISSKQNCHGVIGDIASCIIVSGDAHVADPGKSFAISSYPSVEIVGGVFNHQVSCAGTSCTLIIEENGKINRIDGNAYIDSISVANIQNVAIEEGKIIGQVTASTTSILGKNIFHTEKTGEGGKAGEAARFSYADDVSQAEKIINEGKTETAKITFAEGTKALSITQGVVTIDTADQSTVFLARQNQKKGGGDGSSVGSLDGSSDGSSEIEGGTIRFGTKIVDTTGAKTDFVLAELHSDSERESASYFMNEKPCQTGGKITCISYNDVTNKGEGLRSLQISPGSKATNKDKIDLHVPIKGSLDILGKLSSEATIANYEFTYENGKTFAIMDYIDFHPVEDITTQNFGIYYEEDGQEIEQVCKDGTCTQKIGERSIDLTIGNKGCEK